MSSTESPSCLMCHLRHRQVADMRSEWEELYYEYKEEMTELGREIGQLEAKVKLYEPVYRMVMASALKEYENQINK